MKDDGALAGAPTFAQVLAEAVSEAGLSLEEIRRALDRVGYAVTTTTLSYWQSGRSMPRRADSIRAVVALEHILDTPAGLLTAGLNPTRAAHVLSRLPAVGLAARVPQLLERVFEELSLPVVQDCVIASIHDTLTLHDDGRSGVQRTRWVVRASADGLRVIPGFYQETREETGPPQLRAVRGCTIGASRVVVEEALIVSEVVLPRPLQSGESVMFELEVEWQRGVAPILEHSRSTQYTVWAMQLGVDFDGSAPPEVEYRWRPGPDSQFQTVRRVPVVEGAVQVCLAQTLVGEHGLVWE